jgi:peptidoglycan/xylan/chitin deacetylase (PgdA/CDA1 family)
MRAVTAWLGAAALAHLAPAALFSPALRDGLAPALSGYGDPGHVALTFDDGPHPDATPRFLAVLARYQVHATFFVLGRELSRTPWLGQQIIAQGHELAVHGWDHRCLLRRGPYAVYGDLTRTVAAIERAGGRARWVRAPYGVFSGASLLAARRLGLTPVLWTCWGRDWTRRSTSQSVLATVRRGLRGGGTILLHDSDVAATPGSWQAALGALPALLEHCRDRRLTVGPLSDHRTQAAR